MGRRERAREGEEEEAETRGERDAKDSLLPVNIS